MQSTFKHHGLLYGTVQGAMSLTRWLPARNNGIWHAEAGKGTSAAVCLPCTPCPAPQTAPMRLEIPLGSSCHPSLAPWQHQLLGPAQFLHVQPSTAVRAQLSEHSYCQHCKVFLCCYSRVSLSTEKICKTVCIARQSSTHLYLQLMHLDMKTACVPEHCFWKHAHRLALTHRATFVVDAEGDVTV